MANQNVALVFRGVITLLLLFGLGAIIYLLATHAIPEENKEHVWTLIGVDGTLTTLAVQWWFGSSKGSSDKTEFMKGTPNG